MENSRQLLLADLKNPGRGRKTALVVQGGGMRASYSMGALKALEDLGLSDSFDYVIGSSAGAINGAYFVAHQADIATKVYSDYLTNREFINPLRLHEVLSVDYLLSVLSIGDTSLDLSKIHSSRTDLRFTMVHYPTGEEKLFSSKENRDDIMELIRASATIPAISNKKITIQGEKYIDGAIVDPVPLKKALELGCTDIVVVLTRSKGFRRKPSRLVYNILCKTYFKD